MAKQKPRPKRRRTKQLHMDGTEPEYVRELDDAAWAYHEKKNERCQLSKEEHQLKDHLIDKMKEHGLGRYETENGLVVTVSATSNVATKPKETEPLTAEDDDDS